MEKIAKLLVVFWIYYIMYLEIKYLIWVKNQIKD